MKKYSLTLVFLAFGMFASTAYGQATRTWVSGTGDDAFPCSRTAPCKTFAGAISKTAAGGEINCLDPGGYGSVTITKSLTIDCSGTFGSILSALSPQGVLVNGAGIEVKLRGLSIDGAGTGTDGIRILQAASVSIENVTFHGFTRDGIEFTPSSSSHLAVTHVTVYNARIGLLAQSNSLISAAIDNSNFVNNTVGVVASDNSRVTCTACNASANMIGFQSQTAGIATVSELSLENCISAHNRSTGTAAGLSVGGGGGSGTSKLRISNVGVYDNSVGFSIFTGGIINTFSNNKIDGNAVPSTGGSLTPLPVM
jgi:hypothetical protein